MNANIATLRRLLRGVPLLTLLTAAAFAEAPEPLVHNAVYRISPMHARRLSLESTGTASGANVRVATTAYVANTGHTVSAQLWRAELITGSTWQFTPMNAQSYRLNATGTTSGSNINQEAGSGNAQKWIVTADNSNGSYKLQSANSSRCLDVAGGSKLSGTNVQLYTDNGTLPQRWKFARQPGTYKPSPSNTGVRPGITLTNQGATTVTTNGAIYENINFTGLVIVKANDVTFLNCKFSGPATYTTGVGLIGNSHHDDIAQAQAKRLLLEDCTMDPAYPSKWTNGFEGHDVTMRRCKIINVVDGLQIKNHYDGYKDGPVDVYIEACYIDELAFFSPEPGQPDNKTHNDGVQIMGGSNINFTGNWITGLLGTGGTHDPSIPPPPGGQANAAFMIKPDSGNISNVHILNNWLGGGSYTMNITNDPPRVIGYLGEINNNKFARNQNSTPTTGDNTKTIVFNNGITGTATGNTYEDNGNPITVRYW